MLLLTSAAHGVQRIAEQIRANHPHVDRFVTCLIQNVQKQWSAKKTKCSDNETPTTFTTVITRRSTWLKSASVCFKNFDLMEHFIDEHLDINKSGAIEEFKHPIKSNNLQNVYPRRFEHN